MKSSKAKTVEERYSKLEHREQILLRPDTYIGSAEEDTFRRWIYDSDTMKMELRDCVYVPGLYKIFDEIVVNAKDHTIRDPTCKNIKISIDEETGEISCYNDGNNGVPVEMHNVHKLWVPELIFGNLLTSENYDDTQLKYVGGKNGYGAKLTNIFSTKFTIEVFDANNGKHYVQRFYDNMTRKDVPKITKKAGKTSYLKISFIPDFKKFGIDNLTNDTIALFKKRAYDIAFCTSNIGNGNRVKVYINDELINIIDFKDYISKYYESDEILKKNLVYEAPNENWKVAAVYDPSNTHGFQHISFVNGINTISEEGGTHVSHVTNKIVKHIQDIIKAKDKNISVTPNQVKENITIFIDCLIDKPAFDSQLKEKLTTQVAKYDVKCDLSDDFFKKFSKTGIVEDLLNFARLKEESGLNLRKISGSKVRSFHIEKLDDAHWAGTKQSNKCILILTEGDSAKTFAVNGLSIIGRERYGVFPLKGKPLNVRDMPSSRVISNEEIKNLISILGLQVGKKYETKQELSTLRYGGILIIADQDLDGSHIKGLIINFIEAFWPGLLTNMSYEFIKTLPTPILKAWPKTDVKKKNIVSFYTLSEFNNWKNKQPDINKYYIKYYKGLGTFVESEAKECFSMYDQKLITYTWFSPKANIDDITDFRNTKSGKSIELVFSEKNRDERKKWLEVYDENDIIENDSKYVTFYDFFNKDMKHFSFYDNVRSIPSLIDMFKPSTRKIMYSAFLKKDMVKKEMKVAQFAAYVSQNSAYHHGEKSLEEAIIGLAQNFVGSNNINLLKPNGNFGSRTTMGKDHASSRYIYTQISSITPYIYRQEDECILKYNNEDGKRIEPKFYIPIIPTILVNESQGIGTGFSCYIPPYNPIDIIENCKNMIHGKKIKQLVPWFRGFAGNVKKVDNYSYETMGTLDMLDENTIRITELPVGISITSYMNYIYGLYYGDTKEDKKDKKDKKTIRDTKKKPASDVVSIIQEIVADNTVNTVNIKITFNQGELRKLMSNGEREFLKKLKLITKFKTTNMHLHSTSGGIKKYDNVSEIFTEYYDFRLSAYADRKVAYLAILKADLDIIYWKIKFLEMYLANKIIIHKRTTANVCEQLETLKFPKFFSKSQKKKISYDEDDEENEENEDDEKKAVKVSIPSYTYLLSMSISSLTSDNMEKLKNQHKEKEAIYNKYQSTTIQEIWLSELDELEKEYPKWLIEDTDSEAVKKQPKKAKVNSQTKIVKKTIAKK